MALKQKNEKSLHNRVNDLLRGIPNTQPDEQSEAATIEALSDQLHKAEEHLKAVQARVDRLKWALAKAKS